MAYFAQLNDQNVVMGVAVIADQDCMIDDVFSEAKGIEYCKTLFGQTTNWLETFQDGKRIHFASVGYTFNPTIIAGGGFIPPQPYPSWVLNSAYEWEAPVPYPTNGLDYFWSEPIINWALFPEQYNSKPVITNEQNLQGGGNITFYPPSYPTPKITKWMWKEKGSSVKTEFVNTNNSLTITIPTQETIEIGCINNDVEVWSGDILVSPL